LASFNAVFGAAFFVFRDLVFQIFISAVIPSDLAWAWSAVKSAIPLAKFARLVLVTVTFVFS